jgi:hypothetical protein
MASAVWLSILAAATVCSTGAGALPFHHKDKAQQENADAAPAGRPEPSPAAQASQKLLKSLKTPFDTQAESDSASGQPDPLASLSLVDMDKPTIRPSLSDRLHSAQLFLPGHMTIGKTVEFTVKGKPGSWVALAMADKDTGAKAIMGRKIRLGPDRKVVAAGHIPESGVVALSVDTPIEGDLVGQCLYFEAALWTKPDMSDTEIASVVRSEEHQLGANGVMIAADTNEKKKGLRFVPDTPTPIMSRQSTDTVRLESGKP